MKLVINKFVILPKLRNEIWQFTQNKNGDGSVMT